MVFFCWQVSAKLVVDTLFSYGLEKINHGG